MKLREYLENSQESITEFAQRIGESYAVVHNWLTEKRKPSGENMAVIQRATGGKVLPVDFYGEAAE
jgi:DNA-binding transcriptional regulator YdaS (Cro superfamily)